MHHNTRIIILLIVCLIFSSRIISIEQDFLQYDSGKIAFCEDQAIRLGTEMADTFNSPIGNQNWLQRMVNTELFDSLLFKSWINISQVIRYNKRITSSQLQPSSIVTSLLRDKWLYFLGDSTVRQVWASFVGPLQYSQFEENAKDYVRSKCQRQTNRTQHKTPGSYPEEGWRGSCGLNEVTCSIPGYGDKGLLTFDWKHFVYEDYDDYLWGDDGLFRSDKSIRKPDLLIVQTGLHSCHHSHADGYSKRYKPWVVNYTMISRHLSEIPKLVTSIRQAVNRGKLGDTMVLMMTSGYSLNQKSQLDQCVNKFNRMMTNVAHSNGFPVMDRGEIERRLIYKYRDSPEESPLKLGIHLSQPAQSIIASTLVRMIQCLKTENTTMSYSYLKFANSTRRISPKFTFLPG
jgi:hypothetical protein